MAEAAELLQQVLNLIERDVQAIDRLGKHGDKLEHLVAQDLVRYSGALLDLSSTLDAKKKEEKNRFSKMSTEELMKHAKEIIEGKAT